MFLGFFFLNALRVLGALGSLRSPGRSSAFGRPRLSSPHALWLARVFYGVLHRRVYAGYKGSEDILLSEHDGGGDGRGHG